MTHDELVAELEEIRTILHGVQGRIVSLTVALTAPPPPVPQPLSGGGPGEEK